MTHVLIHSSHRTTVIKQHSSLQSGTSARSSATLQQTTVCCLYRLYSTLQYSTVLFHLLCLLREVFDESSSLMDENQNDDCDDDESGLIRMMMHIIIIFGWVGGHQQEPTENRWTAHSPVDRSNETDNCICGDQTTTTTKLERSDKINPTNSYQTTRQDQN